MEIIHTFWDSKELHFWIETQPEIVNYQKNFSRLVLNKSNVFPQTRNFSQIIKVLKLAGLKEDKIKSVNEKKFLLNINSKNTNPISNASIKAKSTDNFLLTNSNEYFVDTISFNPYDALDILLRDHQTPNMYFKTSESLEYWKRIVRFGLELINKERFIPYFEILNTAEDTIQFTGKWKCILDVKDKVTFDSIVQVYPQYLMNIDFKNQEVEILVISFLNQIIDQFLRRKIELFLPNLNDCENIDELEYASMKWFKSLFSITNEIIELETSVFNHLNGLMNSWFKNTNHKEKRLLRLCFKLDPPNIDEGETSWKLEYYLQAVDDFSILIPASNIWNYNVTSLGYLEKNFENPKERLLIDLASSSKIYPKIEESFEESFPNQLLLRKNEAFYFLENIVPLLETKNYGLLLPSWWNNPEEKLSIKMKVCEDSLPSKQESLFRMGQFLKFEWEIAIGDTYLSIEEFEKLSELKVPFVRLRGKWIKFDSEQIRTILEKIKTTYDKLSINTALQLELQADEEYLTEDNLLFEFDDNGLFDEFKVKIGSSSRIKTLPIPHGFSGTLRPYQIDGFSWINYLKDFGIGACLADDMGLGKTIQIIAFLLHEKENSTKYLPSLLICPTSIVGNWYKEIQRFAPDLRVFVFHGTNRPNRVKFEELIKNTDLIITTYNLALRDKTLLSRIPWDNIILDEAQNIKNPQAKQTKAIKSLQCEYRIALTGTPIENRLTELWSIFDFLNQGYLGNIKYFTEKFVTPIEKDNNKTVQNQLAQIIKPFILRRLKTDPLIIQDLPEKIETTVYCSLNEEQALLYEATVKDLFNQLNEKDDIQRKGLVLATITKLKQICNHPAQFMHEKTEKLENRSCKFERLNEMLQEIIENDEKAIIFTQFKELGDMLKSYIQKQFGIEPLFLSGDTPQKIREKMVESFQCVNESEGPKLFILSIKAGGVGLNLTAANHVFHIDRWWNPAVENQATDRAYRIGQKNNVMVHKFVCIGTLEESIDTLIGQKKELANSIIHTGDVWLTELSTEDLRQVLSLRSIL